MAEKPKADQTAEDLDSLSLEEFKQRVQQGAAELADVPRVQIMAEFRQIMEEIRREAIECNSSPSVRSGNRTRMTRMGRILTGLIEQDTFRENPSHPSHPCPVFLTRPEPGQSGLGHGQEAVL